MLRASTTLVLGAGASAPYGYPIGSQLRLELIKLAEPATHSALRDEGVFGTNLLDFVREFQRSQTPSVDAFLARRPEFAEVGKQAIATVLLKCEDEDALLKSEPESHWYRYLLKSFTTATWDELDFSCLSIVTFNYDRSLEHYLLFALMHAYNKRSDAVLKKLSALSITHLYGSLGPTLPGSPDYLHYAGGASWERVHAAAKSLSVIPEGRDEDATIVAARSALVKADAIAFLGFGYDDTNLHRLDFGNSCNTMIVRPHARLMRAVVGSCMGMTTAEVRKVANQILDPGRYGSGQLPVGFFNHDCLGTLRESLILG